MSAAPPTELPPTTPLISAAELERVLRSGATVLLDASAPRPGQILDCGLAFSRQHLPGARFLDLERLVDPAAPFPHTVPRARRFAERAGALGIGTGTHVVVYEQDGLFAAPRAWFLFRLFGHDRVRVLDGGLEAWREFGGGIETGDAAPATPARFVPRTREALLVGLAGLEAATRAGAAILDARPAGRFSGAEPEPRPGVPAGHIPGSRNLPYTQLADETGRFRPRDELAALFAARGVGPGRQVIASCGSGITAAALALALAELGHHDAAVFDGSWTEYASSGRPIETGA